jgi:thiamine kinase-like enzyme
MTTGADLRAILTRLEPLLGRSEGAPVALDGGITNRNYRARLGGEDYVIRLPGRNTALLGISREAERIAGVAAAELGIAPAVAAAHDDCLVTRFVACRPATAAELAAEPEPIAQALRVFHEGAPTLPARFWVPQLAESYAAIVRGRGRALPVEYEHARAVARQIAAARPLCDAAPCHNDLLTANVIILEPDQRPMLVDWEYAGMGDRFFDLGNLSVNNEFDADADQRLLRAYLGREPDAQATAALFLMRAMSDVREAVWGVVQGAISELEFDFPGYAERHFNRLRETTSSPRFGESLRACAA